MSKRVQFQSQNMKKTCVVIRFGSLGDTLFAVPALNLLTRYRSRVILIHLERTPKQICGGSLLKHNGFLSNLPFKNFKHVHLKNASILSVRALSQRLAKNGGEVLYLPHQNEPLYSIFAKQLLFGAKIFFRILEQHSHRAVSLANYISLNFCRAPMSFSDFKELQDLYVGSNKPENKPTGKIVFSISSAKEHKRWPSERFFELISRCKLDFPNHELVVIGLKEDRQLIELVKEIGGVCTFDTPNFKSLRNVLKGSKVVVTNEGGFGHLASLWVKNIIVIANSIEAPGFVTPISKNVFELREDVPCAPCGQLHHCDVLANYRCNAVSVERVVQTIKTLNTHSG